MTQVKNNKLPEVVYANAYVEHWIDSLGKYRKDLRFGELCDNKESLPDHYEISAARAKYLGPVKITIEKL